MKVQQNCRDRNVADGLLTDVSDATIYKQLLQDVSGQGDETLLLTGTFNTDDVQLFSSPKTDLWPIFVCVNELPPKIRFSRKHNVDCWSVAG